MWKFATGILFSINTGCVHADRQATPLIDSVLPQNMNYRTIAEIPVPMGYTRLGYNSGSFEGWLRRLQLKKDKTVYLYDGSVKKNQSAQFAVVDMPRSKTDLQQCADVVMRLRAEYLFAVKKFDSIKFMDFSGKWYNWQGGGDRGRFEQYLQTVFGWCGSASLEKQLKPVIQFENIRTGDILIKGGFPGHAMLVTDMAVNTKGEKIFLLVQGYQPAQDMHVVVNPLDKNISPWYSTKDVKEIITPEWTFYPNQLRSW